MLGEFLEISVSTADILGTVEFFQRLGFQQAPVGETWAHPYAVLTDGRVAIGLHQYDFPSPSLTFVLPELRSRLSAFEQTGIEFEFCKLAPDEFNEAGFTDPDAQMITLLEARTYSPLQHGVAASLCGYFLEYRIGVSDCAVSRRFWESVGMVTAKLEEAAGSYVQLARSGLNIGLQQRPRKVAPQLVFVLEQFDELTPMLEARAIPYRRGCDYDGAEMLAIDAPDGMQLLIRDRD